eukprot:s4950_g3.t1
MFFPTCQVRVTQQALPDFICQLQIAAGTAGLHLPAPDPSGHCRTSSATSSRSQWALPLQSRLPDPRLPDFNRELQIPVGTAGLQPRAPDRSGHCRTSTASSRSQLGTAGLQPRVPDPSGHCRASTGLPDPSGHCRTSTCIHARKNAR